MQPYVRGAEPWAGGTAGAARVQGVLHGGALPPRCARVPTAPQCGVQSIYCEFLFLPAAMAARQVK